VNTKRHSLLILAAIAVLFTLIWTGFSPSQDRSSSIPNTTIKVDVDLVLVNISECCLKEAAFLKGQMFSRCPRCSALTVWEFISRLVSS
jgi:hypothetical protein